MGAKALPHDGRPRSSGQTEPTTFETLTRAVPGWERSIDGWLDELPELISGRLERVGDNEDLLAALITKGVLPRYAFPVDLVALWTREPSRRNRGEEVQRDLQIALSEYAPDAEVVIDGRRYRSVGLYTPFEEAPRYEPDSWFYECPDCHHVQVVVRRTEEPNWDRCSVCEAPITGEARRSPVAAIRPQGFRTDWTAKGSKYRGGFRERAGSATGALVRRRDRASNVAPGTSGSTAELVISTLSTMASAKRPASGSARVAAETPTAKLRSTRGRNIRLPSVAAGPSGGLFSYTASSPTSPCLPSTCRRLSRSWACPPTTA